MRCAGVQKSWCQAKTWKHAKVIFPQHAAAKSPSSVVCVLPIVILSLGFKNKYSVLRATYANLNTEIYFKTNLSALKQLGIFLCNSKILFRLFLRCGITIAFLTIPQHSLVFCLCQWKGFQAFFFAFPASCTKSCVLYKPLSSREGDQWAWLIQTSKKRHIA